LLSHFQLAAGLVGFASASTGYGQDRRTDRIVKNIFDRYVLAAIRQ
jgi:hypothetical protein